MASEFMLNIIVSNQLDSLYSVCKEYQAMKSILGYLTAKGNKMFVEKQEKYAWLMELKRLEENKYLIDPSIIEILNYDAANTTELCLTLYTYLVCNHSLKKTGELLFTHTNTILYRIQKMKDEFNINTDTPKTHLKYILSLALALLKLNRDDLFIMQSSDDNSFNL